MYYEREDYYTREILKEVFSNFEEDDEGDLVVAERGMKRIKELLLQYGLEREMTRGNRPEDLL